MKCTFPGCESEATHQEVLDKTLPTGEYNCAAHAVHGHSDVRYSLEPLDPTMNDLYQCTVILNEHIVTWGVRRFAEYKVTFERLDKVAHYPTVLAVTAQRIDGAVIVRILHMPGADLSFVWEIFR